MLQPPPGPGFGGADGLSARPIRVPVGAIGLGAPLFDAAGDVRITIPAGRFDPTLEPKLGALLVSVAADISADLRDSAFIRDA